MKNKLLLMVCVFTFFTQISAQQKTCSSDNDAPLLDLNSITKCSVDKTEDNKAEKISVKVISRKRVLRKRDEATGVFTNNHTHKLANMKKKISKINSLKIKKVNKNKVMLFNYIEEIPLFKACESASLLQQEKCFREQLSKHIKKNFRYPELAYSKGIQGRVFVFFVIDTDGSIKELKTVSPYKGEALGKEAERIIKKLPNLIPGKQAGVATPVKYGLPITFKIPGVSPSNIKKVKEKKNLEQVFSFNRLEKIPEFSECINKDIKCFNEKLINHVQENFAYPQIAIQNRIQGIVNVSFVIDKNGEVINIKAKGPENGIVLEEAANDLVKKLPIFKPAVREGKKVNAIYSFPINFSLN